MPSSTTLTVLVTDVTASTTFRHEQGDVRAHERMATLDAGLRATVTGKGGEVVKGTGDGLLIVFESARSALLAAIDVMRSSRAGLEGTVAPLEVRAGLHTGEAIRDGADVFGVAVDAAFRINSRASSNQILVSEMVRGVLGGASEFTFHERGRHRLKGFKESWRLYEVPWQGSGDSISEGEWAFLFCDMVGSTEAALELDERSAFIFMRSVTAILRSAAATSRARMVKPLGDGGLAVFDFVDDAVTCAVNIQEACQQYEEGGGRPIPMKVAVHFGPAFYEAGEFYGTGLFVGARTVSVAAGGEILLTDEARVALATPGATFGPSRVETLRGHAYPRTVHPFLWQDQ